MKILLVSLLVLLVSTYALETFTESQLDTELSENKKIWLVYRSGNSFLMQEMENINKLLVKLRVFLEASLELLLLVVMTIVFSFIMMIVLIPFHILENSMLMILFPGL